MSDISTLEIIISDLEKIINELISAYYSLSSDTGWWRDYELYEMQND